MREEDDGEEEYKVVDEEEDFIAMTKPAPPPRSPAKPIKAPVKAKASQPKVATASGGGEGLSLSERLALRMQGMGLSDRRSSPLSKPAKVSTPPKPVKTVTPPKPFKATTATKRPLSKAKVAGEGGKSAVGGVGLTPEAKKAKVPVKEESKERGKRTAVKSKYVEEDSEEEVEEMDEGSDSDWEN